MIAGFTFVHDDRTYACHAEERAAGEAEWWWWFTVTRDGNRYAPFHAVAQEVLPNSTLESDTNAPVDEMMPLSFPYATRLEIMTSPLATMVK